MTAALGAGGHGEVFAHAPAEEPAAQRRHRRMEFVSAGVMAAGIGAPRQLPL
ncbi:hypothetical protein [Paralimibaculum aggregatum]|uniref:hypothetical protein n=1 Tax=Paralimibaculum aggregatum TaxID=3036245 RepID=UPI0025553D7D|nr:hypothetical protein [Limibaculum sp. NKW23]